MEGISTSGKAPSAILKPTDLSHPFKRRRLIVDRIISFGRSTRRLKPARNNPLFDLESLAVNHASLQHRNGKFYLQKNGDNATYINDKKLLEKPEELYYGDIVQFGKNVIGDSGKPGCIQGVLKLYNSDGKRVKHRPRRSPRSETLMYESDIWKEEEKEKGSEISDDDESSQTMPHQENILKRKRSDSDASDDEENENESSNESDKVEKSPKGECNRANLKPYGLMSEYLKTYLMSHGEEKKPRTRSSRSNETILSDHSVDEDKENEDRSEDEEKEDSSEDEEKENSIKNSTDNESENDADSSNAGTHTEPPHLMQHVDVVSALRLLVQQNRECNRANLKPYMSDGEKEKPRSRRSRSTESTFSDYSLKEDEVNEDSSENSTCNESDNDEDNSNGECNRANLKPHMSDGKEEKPRSRSSRSTQKQDDSVSEDEENQNGSENATDDESDNNEKSSNDKRHLKKYNRKDLSKKSEISALLKPGDPTSVYRIPEHTVLYTKRKRSSDSTLSSNLKKEYPEKRLKTSFSSTGSSRTHSDALLTKEDNTGCKIIDQITTKDKKHVEKYLKKDSQGKSEIPPLLRGSTDSTLSSNLKKKHPEKSLKTSFSSTGSSRTHSDALLTKEDNTGCKIIDQITTKDKKHAKKYLKKDSQGKSEISSLLRGSSDSTLSSSMVTQRPKESQKNSSFSSFGAFLTHCDALVTKKDKKPPKKYLKKDSRGKSETSYSSKGSSNSTLSSSIVTELPKESQKKSFFSSIGASLTHSDALVTKEDDGANKIIHQIPTYDKKPPQKHLKKDSRRKSQISPLLRGSSDSTLSSSIVTELPKESQKKSFFSSIGASLTHSDALVTKEDDGANKIIHQIPTYDKKPPKKHLKKDSRRKSQISPLLRGSSDSPLSSSMVTQLPKESQKDSSFSSNGASLRHSDALVTQEDDGANKIIHQTPTYDKKPPKKHLKKDSRRKSQISPLLRGSSDSSLSSSMVTQLPKESQKDSSFSSNGASLRHSDALVIKEDNAAGKIIDQIPSDGKISNSNNASKKETLKLPSKKHVYKNVKDNDTINQDVSRISSHKTRKRFGNTKLHHTLIQNKISKNEVEGNQAVTPSCSHVAESSNLRRESNNEIAHQDFSLEKLSYRKEVTVKVSSISETSPDTDASGNKFNKYIEKDNSLSNFLTENLTGDSVITDDASISSSEIKVLDNACLSQASSMQETSEGGELTIVKVSSINETSPDTDASGNKFNKYIEKDNSDSNFLTENLTGDSIITDDASISSSEIKVLDNACLSQASSMQETSEGGELTIDEAVANLKIIASDNEDYYNHLCNLDTCFFASSHSQFYASVIKKLSLPGSSSKIVPLHESNEKINNPKYIDSALEKNSEEKVINEGSSSRDCLSRNKSSETENNHPTQIPPESHNLHLKNELTLPSEKLVMKKQFTDTLKKICDLAEIPKENFEIESCNIISEFESSVFNALKTESVKRDMLHTVLSMLDRLRSFQSFLKKI